MSNVNSCHNSRPAVETATFSTSGSFSQCLPNSPTQLVNQGEGVIFVQVVGTTYDDGGKLLNQFSSGIDCNMAGNCCVNVEVPADEPYKIFIRYIQRNTVNCDSYSNQCNWFQSSQANVTQYPVGYHNTVSCDSWNIQIDQSTGLGTCY